MNRCETCKGQISAFNIEYKGYNFHRGCFIRTITKNVKDEEERNEIFNSLGITADVVATATNQRLVVQAA